MYIFTISIDELCVRASPCTYCSAYAARVRARAHPPVCRSDVSNECKRVSRVRRRRRAKSLTAFSVAAAATVAHQRACARVANDCWWWWWWCWPMPMPMSMLCCAFVVCV